MGCVYSNQRFSSKRKSNSELSPQASVASATNTATNGDQTPGDSVRWNNSSNNNHYNGHINADNVNNLNAISVGVGLGGVSSTTTTSTATTTSSRSHTFNACLMNDDFHEVHQGKLEITDNNLIFRTKGRSHTVWPLRYLRKYGSNNDIFSFECGRRCSTGEGVYAFKCSNAEQLFQILSEVIANVTLNSFANTINNVIGNASSAANGSLPNHHHHGHHILSHPSQAHSNHSSSTHFHHHLLSSLNPAEIGSGTGNGNLPEYQNLAPFGDNDSRPHSSLAVGASTPCSISGPNSDSHSHTYLNSGGATGAVAASNVIGLMTKSQPNYYTSNPLSNCSNHSSQFDISKNGSLNGYLSDKKLVFLAGPHSSSSDHQPLQQQCSTLPASNKTIKNNLINSHHSHPPHTQLHNHEYVNSNVVHNNCPVETCQMPRRKSSDQHLYENHELPILHSIKAKKLEEIRSKMTASDDLGTFCYVNINSDSRKDRMAYMQAYNLNKSARTTPEPQCYIQLDLNSKSTEDPNVNVNKCGECELANQSPDKNSTENLDSITSNNNKKTVVTKDEVNNNNVITNLNKAQTSSGSSRSTPSGDNIPNGNRRKDSSSANSAVISATNGNNNNNDTNKQTSATVPYAQIDFAKTLALSNSAANHRKL